MRAAMPYRSFDPRRFCQPTFLTFFLLPELSIDIRIHAAAPADSEAIAAMAVELLQEIMALTGGGQFPAQRESIDRCCAHWLRDDRYAVFLAGSPDGGSPLGFSAVTSMRSLYAGGIFGVITEFYVRPGFRSEGIGALLLEAAKSHAREQGWLRLEVTTPPLPQFERTLQFYESHGFEVTGGRKMKLSL